MRRLPRRVMLQHQISRMPSWHAPAAPCPIRQNDSVSLLKIWGKLYAKHEATGYNLYVMDRLLAATALHHGLTVITRKTSDFPHDVKTKNPWLG